jgi:hypothetical protein
MGKMGGASSVRKEDEGKMEFSTRKEQELE